MQFVVFGKLADQYHGKPIGGLRDLLQDEWAKSREYYSQGILRNIWLFEKNGGSMAIFEAESREHMEELNAQYPLVQRGYTTHDIRAIEPYVGFYPELVK